MTPTDSNPLAYAIALDETFFKDSPKERLRVAVDVENRSEIDMYAHAPALLPYGTAVFVEERIVLNGS